MRRDRRRAIAADVAEVFLLELVVRGRQHFAVYAQPLDAPRTVAALATAFPERGICAAEAEQRVLRPIQGDVVGVHLEGEHGDVGVEEEIEIGVRDLEDDRRAVLVSDAHLRDVGAAEDPDAGFAVTLRGLLADTRAVQEALHVGQEGYEFLVMTLLEFEWIRGIFVPYFAPGIRVAERFERFPVTLHLHAGLERHELQRPEDDLAEMAHDDGCGCVAHDSSGPRIGSAARKLFGHCGSRRAVK